MNSDHAPTAEEQLPPLDITQADKAPPVGLYLGMEKEFLERLNCRTRQLLAALRENRENREKDARIAELEEDVRLAKHERNQYDSAHKREVVNVLKLSAKLRAVSDAYTRYFAEGRVDALLARIREAIK